MKTKDQLDHLASYIFMRSTTIVKPVDFSTGGSATFIIRNGIYLSVLTTPVKRSM